MSRKRHRDSALELDDEHSNSMNGFHTNGTSETLTNGSTSEIGVDYTPSAVSDYDFLYFLVFNFSLGKQIFLLNIAKLNPLAKWENKKKFTFDYDLLFKQQFVTAFTSDK